MRYKGDQNRIRVSLLYSGAPRYVSFPRGRSRSVFLRAVPALVVGFLRRLTSLTPCRQMWPSRSNIVICRILES